MSVHNLKNIFNNSEYNKFIKLVGNWQDGDLTRYNELHDLLAKLPGVTRTVYRGQFKDKQINKEPTQINSNILYFSTSTDREEAELFSNTDCCMFIIHLVNVPAYYLGSREKEYLVLGGGTFWQNKKCTIEGFKKLENGLFECWYTIPEQTDISLDTRDLRSKSKESCLPGMNCIIFGGSKKRAKGTKRSKLLKKTINKKQRYT
jgi:hypothetical protein